MPIPQRAGADGPGADPTGVGRGRVDRAGGGQVPHDLRGGRRALPGGTSGSRRPRPALLLGFRIGDDGIPHSSGAVMPAIVGRTAHAGPDDASTAIRVRPAGTAQSEKQVEISRRGRLLVVQGWGRCRVHALIQIARRDQAADDVRQCRRGSGRRRDRTWGDAGSQSVAASTARPDRSPARWVPVRRGAGKPGMHGAALPADSPAAASTCWSRQKGDRTLSAGSGAHDARPIRSRRRTRDRLPPEQPGGLRCRGQHSAQLPLPRVRRRETACRTEESRPAAPRRPSRSPMRRGDGTGGK